MVKSIDTLIPDIQALFEGTVLSDGLGQFKDKLGEVFLNRFEKYAEERRSGLSLSAIGRPLRQLWYQMKGYKGEDLPPEVKLKFLYGDMIEQLVIFLAIEAGHEVTRLQEEVMVDEVPGHIDCFVDGVLCDIKSCSTYSFAKFAERTITEDDPFGYIGQLAGYSCAYGGVDGAFIAIDKTLGKICLCKFTGEELGDYNVRDRIARVREAIASDAAPGRCYEPKPISRTDKSGNLILGVGCSYCQFKETCWSDANNGAGLKKYIYASGPKWFTHIEKEPRVPQFEEFPIKLKESEQ